LDALPAVPAGFTGRADTLAGVLDALDPTPASGRGAAAVVVAGLAGVGKTSLALVAAHTTWTRGTPPDVPAGAPTTDTNAGPGPGAGAWSRAWFDDVLFVDLRGYDARGGIRFYSCNAAFGCHRIRQLVSPTTAHRDVTAPGSHWNHLRPPHAPTR